MLGLENLLDRLGQVAEAEDGGGEGGFVHHDVVEDALNVGLEVDDGEGDAVGVVRVEVAGGLGAVDEGL